MKIFGKSKTKEDILIENSQPQPIEPVPEGDSYPIFMYSSKEWENLGRIASALQYINSALESYPEYRYYRISIEIEALREKEW